MDCIAGVSPSRDHAVWPVVLLYQYLRPVASSTSSSTCLLAAFGTTCAAGPSAAALQPKNEGSPGSCKGKCGDASMDPETYEVICYCDQACVDMGDCCSDHYSKLATGFCKLKSEHHVHHGDNNSSGGSDDYRGSFHGGLWLAVARFV